MNREIKFRAWSFENKEFISFDDNTGYGPLIDKNGKIFFLDNGGGLENFENVEIQQYTGCKDGSGKEIYEGDILKYKNRNGKVEFFSGAFYCCWDDQTDDQLSYMMIDDMQVIGNVFEYKK